MKLKLLLVTFLLSITCVFSQGINYKALIKDGSGNVVANQSVTVQFQILQGAGMNNVYQETHMPTTDVNGIVIINIGEGSVNSGVFANIDWGSDDHFLNVQINTGGGLTDMGTTQFMAVPYALNAATNINELSDGKSDTDGTEDGSSVFLGVNAGLNDDGTDNKNVAVGFEALKANTYGFNNTANGSSALLFNSTGTYNTATGSEALRDNTIGNSNTATGRNALGHNISGSYNTATGAKALLFNETGSLNTATGTLALHSNDGDNNTASGGYSLYNNMTGHENTASGGFSLYNNTTGYENTANGFHSLFSNDTGRWNTANGTEALYNNTMGSFNTAIGRKALYNCTVGSSNTAIGRNALSNIMASTNNIGIGWDAQVPSPLSSNQIRLGNTNITYAGVQVPWTVTSDKRWKENIRDLPYGLKLIKQLNPVDYVRKNNDANTREMGFIAQDVEALLNKVGYKDQGFLSKDDKGYISLRYNDFIALLTKAMQEQQKIIEDLKKDNKTQNKNYKKLLSRVVQIETRSNQ